MLKVLVFSTTVLLILLPRSTLVESRRHARKQSVCDNDHLTQAQKRYLEEILVLAHKGGLPEEDLKSINEYDEEVCYEIDCLESALEVMQSTNFTIDPCDSKRWLEFACARRVNGPDNINQLERLIKLVEKQTLSLLEDNTGAHDDDVMYKEAKTHFYQCLHKAQSDETDLKDIMKYSGQYGNWPILTNKDPGEKFNWLHMLADLNRIERPGHTPYLFQVHVPEFFKKMGPIELNVGRAIWHVSSKDLVSMLTTVQKKLGRKKPVRIEQLVPMLSLMANISSSTIIHEEPKVLTIKQLQNMTDAFFNETKIEMEVDWLSFFKRVFKGADNIKVTPKLPIKVSYRKAMVVLAMVDAFQSSKQKIERWAVSNLLQFQLITTLLQEATTLLDDKNSFKCVEISGDRKEICLGGVQEVFGYSLGATYIKVFYNDSVTPVIKKLVNYIKGGYIDIIGKTHWMEKKTQDFLIDKIKNIKTFIAYPEWIKDKEKLAEFYEGLELSTNKSSSYPTNYMEINMWRLAKKRSWSYKYHNLTSWKGFPLYDVEWNHYPATVQAQYHKAINEARVEAGVIQKPIFGANRPGFMNFGGLGMILAHEFGHSFDIIGRMFNKDGENDKEYWDEASLVKYFEWVQQVAEQYGSEPYPLSETSAETIDPWKTINEDIADILAVYISYHSYQTYLKELKQKGEKEKILPGLKSYTPQQLFYMKYANVRNRPTMWCDNKDIQDRYNDMLGDHSSGTTRATLPLKYSKQFAKAFHCEIPKEKTKRK